MKDIVKNIKSSLIDSGTLVGRQPHNVVTIRAGVRRASGIYDGIRYAWYAQRRAGRLRRLSLTILFHIAAIRDCFGM